VSSPNKDTFSKPNLKAHISTLLRERVCTTISPDVLYLMKQAQAAETSESAREMLKTQIENVSLAEAQKKPVCQSPGFPTVYIKYGGCLRVSDLTEALAEEFVNATDDGFLRPSIVHPLTRKNTGNNSGPGVPNFELEYDPDIDYIDVIVSLKGCGAELGNALRIMTPAQIGQNYAGVKEFVVDTVIKAGGKPCPPFAIGIGIGGQMDICAKLSRRAVSTRKWTDHHPNPELAAMEDELMDKINQLGIGPGGIGGRTTALAVKIGLAYTHTAICPVAINFYCWVARRNGLRLYPDGRTEYLFAEEAN
jgi:fumarate hydratase subunit alpha